MKQEGKMRGENLEPLNVIGVQIPYHFRCPISLELMRDPVTVITGQTYDRTSIESWVATGNTTCPVTRIHLSDFNLIPNHTLRRLIQNWCVSNSSFGVERIPTPKQPADPVLIRSLLTQISTVSSSSSLISYETRFSAILKLRRLARDSDKNKSLISTHNPQIPLLSIIFSNTEKPELIHESLSLLVMFQLTESDCTSIASQSHKISFLSSLLSHPSIEVRVNSAALIEIITSTTRSIDLRIQIGNTEGILEGIIKILNHPLTYSRALKIGIKSLFALCLVKQNREKAVSSGAPEVLINRLTDFEKSDAERALATIELLCRVNTGCAEFASNALTIPLLVKIILKISDRATEYAAGALLSLCSVYEELQNDAVEAGIVTQLLLLVQSDCTIRAKRKAQLLLKLLRNSWPDDSIARSDDYNCSDVVPF